MRQLLIGCLLLQSSLCLRIVERIDNSGHTIVDGPFGGTNGFPFSDEEYHLNGNISGIFMRSGSVVDAISVRYGDKWGPLHGGGGGYEYQYDMNPGAHIIAGQVNK